MSQFASKSVVVRLSGFVQHNDRLAMREIARQVVEQTGSEKFSTLTLPTDDENPFLDETDGGDASPSNVDGHISLALPPASHLPSLIAQLSSLSPSFLITSFGWLPLVYRSMLVRRFCIVCWTLSSLVARGWKAEGSCGHWTHLTSRCDQLA